jgi:hypothetical protein
MTLPATAFKLAQAQSDIAAPVVANLPIVVSHAIDLRSLVG